MTRLPTITARQLIKALELLGFETARIRGSHHFMRHPDGRRTVVPDHRGEDIGRGLLSKILRSIDVDRDEFLDLL